MLDVGFSEILLTSAIALVVLGPERLPKVARQVGHWMGRARSMARQLGEQLEREVSADELLRTTQSANTIHRETPPYAAAVESAQPASTPIPTATPPTQSIAAQAEPVVDLSAAANATTPAAMHGMPADIPPVTRDDAVAHEPPDLRKTSNE